MRQTNTPAPLRMGAIAGIAVAVLCVAYAAVLSIGLITLPSPDLPIQNPWFTSMEVLVLAIAPAMVAFIAALHFWVPRDRRPMALLSVLFISMCAVVTCCIHFVVLTLSRQPAFATADWSMLVFSFHWPSVVYALDILAWDFFFPLAALCAAAAVQGQGLVAHARNLLLASAVLAFAGLAGVPVGNMNIRNIGIIGYVLAFPVAAVLLAIVFIRADNRGAGEVRT